MQRIVNAYRIDKCFDFMETVRTFPKNLKEEIELCGRQDGNIRAHPNNAHLLHQSSKLDHCTHRDSQPTRRAARTHQSCCPTRPLFCQKTKYAEYRSIKRPPPFIANRPTRRLAQHALGYSQQGVIIVSCFNLMAGMHFDAHGFIGILGGNAKACQEDFAKFPIEEEFLSNRPSD